MNIQLSISNQTRGKVDGRWLKRQLLRTLALLEITRGEWSITVVSDRAMADLHQKTMNLPTTTDVLTFNLAESSCDSRSRGGTQSRSGAMKGVGMRYPRQAGGYMAETLELDTVICRDEAVRRAGELGHSVREELLLYCIHSLLHVRGYDDITAAKAARMHRREDQILLTLGVGAVYAGTKNSPAAPTPRRRKKTS